MPGSVTEMALTIDGDDEVGVDQFDCVKQALQRLDPEEGPAFVILSAGDGGYMQALGKTDAMLTDAMLIEARLIGAQGRFRHYGLRRGPETGKKVELTGNTGNDFAVDAAEALGFEDAAALFHHFWQTGKFPAGYEAVDVSVDFPGGGADANA